MTGVTIDKLKRGECCYPVSAAGKKPIKFCGAPVHKGAYCAIHYAHCHRLNTSLDFKIKPIHREDYK